VITGANTLRNMLPVFLMQSALSALFLVSYIVARRSESVVV